MKLCRWLQLPVVCLSFRFFFVLLILGIASTTLVAGGPQVLEEGKQPADWRLGTLKDYDGYFPFAVPADAKQWANRAERVKRQILVSQGLWPMPEKTPLNAVIHGKIDKGDYTVEKVYFESLSGFYVTGSLYRPVGREGKLPGVLCPHGHWAEGRFYDVGEAGVKKEIEQGAEKFPEGGRSPLQARCVTLAKLGCVVFFYDMIGYADSQQLSFELVHRFAKQRPEMNAPENWGLYSPQAESHLQSVMGLQTLNSIRALDFLESLPDVDPNRIAVTGASGGGTQTMLLAAIDPRIAVSVPAVMVSTSMQGGCTCENSSLLRVGTGNIEFAALFAPKPQLVIAADDWTREMATKGFPELSQLYELTAAKDKVALEAHLEFKHNYNYVNRAAMYHWLNKHFKLGHAEPIVEGDYERLSREELTVWNDEHKKPAGGDDFERKLLQQVTDDTAKQLAAVYPKDAESLAKYKALVGPAIDVLIGRGLPDHEQIEYKQSIKNDDEWFLEMAGVLNFQTPQGQKEQLPLVFLYPKDWNKQVVIWISPEGKSGLYEEDGPLREEVKKLMLAGSTVIGVDLLQQGEFLADGEPLEKTGRVKNPRESGAYTFGYNSSVFAQRVQDILTTVAYTKHHGLAPEEVVVVGLGPEAGPLVAAARAQAGDAIDRAVIDTAGFRFGSVTDLQSPMFLPGGAKYDDLPGMLAVAAPAKLWLAGEGKGGDALVQVAYKAAGKPENLTIYSGSKEGALEAATKWMLTK